MVVVRLSASDPGGGEVEEKTYTDNLSSRGVRVCSSHRWQPGEVIQVAPIDQGPPIDGEVVYCERFDKSRFFVGLKFTRPCAPWRIWQRYQGA